MMGWIEVSLTLRRFAADPQEIARFLGDPSCEIRRAGERINSVSEAMYKDNSIRAGIEADKSCDVGDSIIQILHRWGGVNRVKQALEVYLVEFSDFDIAVYDDPENFDLKTVFLDEIMVKYINKLNGSVGVSSHPIVDKQRRFQKLCS